MDLNRLLLQIYGTDSTDKTGIHYFRRMKKILFGILLFGGMTACSDSGSEAKKIRSQAELEQLLNAWSNDDSLKIPEVATKYDEALAEYLTNYPNNPVHENFLFLAARRDVGQKDYAGAALKYSTYYELYPNSRSTADAVFGAGFLYNNEVNNLDSARKYYEIFLITFPDHMLYDAAKAELEHLGESPEEMLNKMKQALDSTQN